MKSQKGFTLIELLVVIAILGVLAAVVMPNVLGLIGIGNVAAAKAELSSIQTACDAYATEKGGEVPASNGEVDISLISGYLRATPTNTPYQINAQGIVTKQ